MRTLLSLGVMLVMLGAVTASASSPRDSVLNTASGPRMTVIEYVDTGPRPARFQRAALVCDANDFSGSCPTPRQECRDRCYAVHEIDIVLCLSGIEGILPFQREACYAGAVVRLGRCNSQCAQDYPVGLG